MKFFILFIPIFIFNQQRITPKYIDSEFNKIDCLARNGKYKQFMSQNMLVLKSSKRINYPKGIALGYLNLSYGYSYSRNYKKSFEYLKLARDADYAKDNFDFQVNFKRFLGFNYSNIGLYREAINELKEVVLLSDDMSADTLRLYTKSSTYCDIGTIYQHQKQLDSCKLYLRKGLTILKKQKKPTPRLQAILLWYSMGLIEVNITENKIDSAGIKLQSIETLSKKRLGNNNFRLYKIKGLINCHKKEYDLALINYQKAIELAKNTSNVIQLQWLYNAVSKIYQLKGDDNSAQKYFKISTAIDNNLVRAKQPEIEKIVKELIIQKESKIKTNNKLLLYGLVICIFCLLVFMFITLRKRGKKHKNILKDEENILLIEKLPFAYEEIVKMAKNNNPEFLARFQEVYPDFISKLLNIEPMLLHGELRFCAFLFLDFSTKEIATYTFVKPQSIQTRKNRLRKRLNISSDEDIYSWMKNINNTNL